MFTSSNNNGSSSSSKNKQQKNYGSTSLAPILGDESEDSVFEDASSSMSDDADGRPILHMDTLKLLEQNNSINRGLLLPDTGGGASLSSSIRSLTASIVESTFIFDGERASVRDFRGQATVLSEVINIAKNLIGGGALSLSGGMALYSNNPWAVLSATIWIVLLGGMFGYFCVLIARVFSSLVIHSFQGSTRKFGLCIDPVSNLCFPHGDCQYSRIPAHLSLAH
jgi:hypothetical protein